MKRVTIFFEDSLQRGGVPKDYGPGNLVRACVERRLGMEPYSLRAAFSHVPCNGNSKVIGQLKNARGNNNPWPAVAVLDRDQLFALVQPAGAPPCNRVAKAWIAEQIGGSPSGLVFLHENTETLIQQARDIAGPILRQEDVQRALNKELFSRDKILNQVATDPDLAHLPAELCRRNASLDYLVLRVIAALDVPPQGP